MHRNHWPLPEDSGVRRSYPVSSICRSTSSPDYCIAKGHLRIAEEAAICMDARHAPRKALPYCCTWLCGEIWRQSLPLTHRRCSRGLRREQTTRRSPQVLISIADKKKALTERTAGEIKELIIDGTTDWPDCMTWWIKAFIQWSFAEINDVRTD